MVVLAQASGDFWNASEEAAFESCVRAGGGVVAMHNPIDSEQGNAFYRSLIGTEFTAHSAANTPGVLDVVDDEHPSTAELPDSITRNEEWYGFTKWCAATSTCSPSSTPRACRRTPPVA